MLYQISQRKCLSFLDKSTKFRNRIIIYCKRRPMGNETCCKDDPYRSQLPQTHPLPTVSAIREPPPKIPKLSKQIQDHLAKVSNQPFEDRFPRVPAFKKFGEQVYAGQLNKAGRPDGIGKMYRDNGSLFIGVFENGVANGEGHLVKPDGSYYHGRIRNNKANDPNGYYWSPQMEYRGGIVDNKFDGQGKEVGDHYQYKGQYENGHRSEGLLQWSENGKSFEYTGQFNSHGLFHGKGKLWQSGLGTYTGDFQNGDKHGQGQFAFESGKKYIGQYSYGVRQGIGKTINKQGQITYEGNWSNGLPHGYGRARTKDGQYIEKNFVDGMDPDLLEDGY